MRDNLILINQKHRSSDSAPADAQPAPALEDDIYVTRWQYRRLMEVWSGMEPVLELIRADEVCDKESVYYILKPFVRELGSVLMEIDDNLEAVVHSSRESELEEFP